MAVARIEFAAFTNFQPAMRVIGQADFISNLNNRDQPTPTADSLCSPYGNPRVVDGVLYLPDYSNNRVLGYLTVPTTEGAAADFVLGQSDFVHIFENDDNQDGTPDDTASARTLNYPAGIILSGRHLIISDNSNNRYLIFEAQ